MAAAYVVRLATAAWSMPRAVGEVMSAQRALHSTPSTPSVRSTVARLRRIAVSIDLRTARGALWTLQSRVAVRKQLRLSGVRDVQLPRPPSARPKDRRVTVLLLRSVTATCLERSLVLQRFDASAGVPRALIIGVTAPQRGFRAHAWLEGEHADAELKEIVRHETPVAWLADRQP